MWSNMNKYEITSKQKHQFSHDGVILLKGLFANLIELIAIAIDQNLASPGPMLLKIYYQIKTDVVF